MNKTCTRCKAEKDLTMFGKCKVNPDGLLRWCASCTSVYQREYQSKNAGKISCVKSEYYKNNKERLSRNHSNYVDKNRLIICEYKKAHRLSNPDIYRKSSKAYAQNHPDRINASRAKYLNSNPSQKVASLLRSRIGKALSGGMKYESTENLTGCSFTDLKKHIEDKFLPGMSWENRSRWHIDHIRPCASFNLSFEDQQRECFNYTNLQPLWALDNIKKGHKWGATG